MNLPWLTVPEPPPATHSNVTAGMQSVGNVVNPPTPSLPWAQPERPLADTVRLLQADVAYMIKHTAVAVHATGPHGAELSMLANTPRGQQIPTGTGKLSGGHTVTFQDIGMPQPGLPTMTIAELAHALTTKAAALGLEVET